MKPEERIEYEPRRPAQGDALPMPLVATAGGVRPSTDLEHQLWDRPREQRGKLFFSDLPFFEAHPSSAPDAAEPAGRNRVAVCAPPVADCWNAAAREGETPC